MRLFKQYLLHRENFGDLFLYSRRDDAGRELTVED